MGEGSRLAATFSDVLSRDLQLACSVGSRATRISTIRMLRHGESITPTTGRSSAPLVKGDQVEGKSVMIEARLFDVPAATG